MSESSRAVTGSRVSPWPVARRLVQFHRFLQRQICQKSALRAPTRSGLRRPLRGSGPARLAVTPPPQFSTFRFVFAERIASNHAEKREVRSEGENGVNNMKMNNKGLHLVLLAGLMRRSPRRERLRAD